MQIYYRKLSGLDVKSYKLKESLNKKLTNIEIEEKKDIYGMFIEFKNTISPGKNITISNLELITENCLSKNNNCLYKKIIS